MHSEYNENTEALSHHWADVAALRVVKERPEKERYIVASGITPSGKVHVGNFREVITADLVVRALMDLKKQVQFIYSWDNFDTFRKVPKNLPEPKAFAPYLKQPIARIPDPWGKAGSYAQGFMDMFEDELSHMGIKPNFLHQEKLYSTGTYAKDIRHALEHKESLAKILNAYRTSPLAEDWLPTAIYCSRCQKDEMHSERYLGEWDYSYHCKNCDLQETVDIRHTPNLKLAWRIDWPMRWNYEGVDFEAAGKDHSSQGGSYDTAKLIIKDIWHTDPPVYLQYDFVMIKGGAGKMSSSSGELYTLSQVLEVYEPQMIRWIFANHRPNHDFSISFDEDVIKSYDEFDEAEAMALGPVDLESHKYQIIRRTYELSCLTREVPSRLPQRPKFRALCGRLQICSGDIERTYQKFYKQEIPQSDYQLFVERATRAWAWLNTYAPAEYRYTLRDIPNTEIELSALQSTALSVLREIIAEVDLEHIEPKALHELMFQKAIKATGCDSKAFFQAVYQKLISKDHGPRLPPFLKEVGKERLFELL